MKHKLFLAVALAFLPCVSYAQQKAHTHQSTTLCFPLIRDRQYNVFDYIIPLDNQKVINRYKPYFDKYGLKFSGYVWEVVLRDMLADTDPSLKNYVSLRSEANRVLIRANTTRARQEFREYFCKTLSNMVTFNDYIRKVDKSKVPNY
ncbi:MAG: hypothetical protein JST70_16440 [Bacteroidetes bacterium]|nr:hypothetical protein [Bacteroidota bacterium]